MHPKKSGLQKIRHLLQKKNDPNAKPSPASAPEHTPSDTPEPSTRDLYAVAIRQGIPFVGFGIMDNAVMILAGETIDLHLGVALGISTMCAAAIGNIISDISGVMFGTVIEDGLLGWSKTIEKLTRGRVTLPAMPDLSYQQRQLRSVRWSGQLGCAMGLTIGCVIGMFPLLFYPDAESLKAKGSEDNENERLKKEISHWKERFKTLDREKNDGLWNAGY